MSLAAEKSIHEIATRTCNHLLEAAQGTNLLQASILDEVTWLPSDFSSWFNQVQWPTARTRDNELTNKPWYIFPWEQCLLLIFLGQKQSHRANCSRLGIACLYKFCFHNDSYIQWLVWIFQHLFRNVLQMHYICYAKHFEISLTL